MLCIFSGSGDSAWQPHPSQWRAPPAGQQPQEPWNSMSHEFMSTAYPTWQPPPQQQQHGPHPQQQFQQPYQQPYQPQYQGWEQQQQASHPGPPRRSKSPPRRSKSPRQSTSAPPLSQHRSDGPSSVSSDIMAQAMHVIEDTSVQLSSSFDNSSFLKNLDIPVTPQDTKKKRAQSDELNTPSPPDKEK